MSFISVLSAQTTTEKIVRYESFQFLDPIPYQQSFVIRGSRTILKTKSDLGKLIILHEGSVIDSTFWWSTSEEERNFTFYVKSPLEFGKEYNFSFEFYTYADSLKTIQRQLVKILQERVFAEYAGSGRITNIDAEKISSIVITEFGKNFGSVNGNLVSRTSNLKAKNSNFIRFLVGYAQRRKQMQDSIAKKESYKEFILRTLGDNPKYLDSAEVMGLNKIDRKKIEELDQKETRVDFPYNDFSINLESIGEKMKSGSNLNDAQQLFVKNRLKIKNITNVPTQDQKNTINELISNWKAIAPGIRELILKYRLFMAVSERLKSLSDQLETDKKELERLFELDDTFTQIESRAKIISDNGTKLVKVEDLQAVRFSPVIGFAFAPMNLARKIDWQFFGILAVKYYLGPVDKRVAKPYLVNNRLSLMAGVVASSELKYHGQVMENAGLGVKPIIGIGYDIGPLVGINMGTVLFQQSSVNPLISQSKLRGAALVSLTIDIDLFNRLRNLFANQKYKIN